MSRFPWRTVAAFATIAIVSFVGTAIWTYDSNARIPVSHAPRESYRCNATLDGSNQSCARGMAESQSIVDTSTAITTGKANRNFWQNGSATYQTGSSLLSIAANLGGYSPTLVVSTALTLTVGMPSGITPMVNVTQGTSYLANATVPYSFSVSPAISPTPVHVSVVAAFTSAGAVPSVAKYGLWYNWSWQVSIENSSLPSWLLQNGSLENLSVPVTVPSGFTLEGSTLTIPYPGQALPNVTTLNVTTNAGYHWHGPFVNLTTFTSSPGQGFLTVYLPTVSANESLRVHYIVTGLQTGKIPLLLMGPVSLLPSGYYTATATWVNTAPLPYSGYLYVRTNQSLAYSIVPDSLNVTWNYPGHYLKNSTFTLSGNQIVILPGSVTVYGGRVITLTLKFLLIGVPASVGLCLTCPVGSSSVPWWIVAAGWEAAWAFVAIGTFVGMRGRLLARSSYSRAAQARTRGFWISVVLFIVGFLFVALAVFTGGA